MVTVLNCSKVWMEDDEIFTWGKEKMRLSWFLKGYEVMGGIQGFQISCRYLIWFFKRLAYMLTAYFYCFQICDATGYFVKALPMGQNIVLDKPYTKQLGQISILEHCMFT